MASKTLDHATELAEDTGQSAAEAVDSGRQAIDEAMAAAEKVFLEGAKRAEKQFRDSERLFKENLERLREQAKTYGDTAGQSMDEAQRFVVEQVKERPLTAAVAGLGIGFFLGILMSGRNR